jgi:hypothetical protein
MEVHIENILPFLMNMREDYKTKLAVYNYRYSQIDGDYHKQLNEDAIQSAIDKYHADGIRECEEEFGEALDSVNDIIQIGNPGGAEEIESDCARIRYRLNGLLSDISEHESSTKNDTGSLEDLIRSVSQLVGSATTSASGNPTTYNPGDYTKLTGLQEAYMNSIASTQYRDKNHELIGEAEEYETKVADIVKQEQQEKLKKLEEQKEKEKTLNSIKKALITAGEGVVKIVGDVTALVGEVGALISLVAIDAAGIAALGTAVVASDGTVLIVGGAAAEALVVPLTLTVADAGAIVITAQKLGEDVGDIVEKSKGSSSGEGTGHPNGLYEDTPYHGDTGNSVKSKAPTNGQDALDNSLSIGENTDRRISISNDEFVVLDKTSDGLYHGHVRTWDELAQQMQAVLRKAGLVTKKGKIIE